MEDPVLKSSLKSIMGNSCEEPHLCNHPCQRWGPACTTSPFPLARGSPSHRHRLEQPQEKPVFAFSQLTLRLRNAGSPPVWLPGKAAVCGGMQGCPLLAMLFIFLIFVEGNKSWVGECGANDGLGGLTNRALVEGQQVMEVSQHFPATLCVPVAASQGPPLSLSSWIGSVAVGLPPEPCLIPWLWHLLGYSWTHQSKPLPSQKSYCRVSGLVPTRTRALPVFSSKRFHVMLTLIKPAYFCSPAPPKESPTK